MKKDRKKVYFEVGIGLLLAILLIVFFGFEGIISIGLLWILPLYIIGNYIYEIKIKKESPLIEDLLFIGSIIWIGFQVYMIFAGY
ncbi:MAG: hypothetical protein NUV46_03735 [Nanoarchaeota archaeon]|nr:hypothetical protein [Nanoarchaeota archaeon]